MVTSTACLLPRDSQEKDNDYVMLSDVFPTGYHSTRPNWPACNRATASSFTALALSV